MKSFKTEIKNAPPLLKALVGQNNPLQRLAIAHFDEDGEAEYEQIVWGEKLDREVYRIISPVWVSEYFKYGDIVGNEGSYSFNEVECIDDLLKPSDYETWVLVPIGPTSSPEALLERIQSILGSADWICEVVGNRMLVIVLSKEAYQEHGNRLRKALDGRAHIRLPGPWCAKYLEAMLAGDEAKAIEEFLREEVEEAV